MPSFRVVLCASLTVAALGAASGEASAQARGLLPIAYVSLQRILAEADSAKAAAKELDALRAAKAEDLAAKKKVLDATRLQVANAGGFFSTSKREQLKDVEKKQEAELQKATQDAQTSFQERQRALQEELRNELMVAVTGLARQRGFQYVLNQDAALVLAPTGVDLTAEVLLQINAAAAKRNTAKDDVKKPD